MKRLTLALIAGLALILAGSLEAPFAQERPLEKIRISFSSPSYPFLPGKIAIDKGYFRYEGLAVDFFQMSPRLVVAAMSKGDLAYTLSFSAVVDGALLGFPFRIVSAITTKPLHYLVSRPDLGSVHDLKGKVLGVSAVGDTDHVVAAAIVEALGGDPKTLKPLALGNEAIRSEALKQRKIDVLAVTPPWPVRLKQEGYNVLGGPKELKAGSPISSVGTTEKKIREAPQEVKSVIRAILKGLRFVFANREGTIEAMVSWLGQDVATATASYDLLVPSLSTDGKAPVESYVTGIQQRKEILQVKEIPVTQLLDWRLLEEVQREMR